MKIVQRVTLLGGGVGLTLLLLLYSFNFYSPYNVKPLPLLLGPYEKECPPVTSPCIITAYIYFPLGNQLLLYWFLIAAAKRLNCTAYLSPHMAEKLRPHFRLSLPVLAPEVYYTTAWTFVDVQDAPSKCRADFLGENIVLVGFPTIYRPAFPFLENVRRDLVLKPEIADRAQQKLREIGRMKRYKTFVGVHARRGELAVLNIIYRIASTDAQFYSSAMNHFRSKYGRVAFVVVSDDMEWCERNIDNKNGDVFYEGGGSAIDDFALLANCNHSVIGYSTFAYFAAILCGGDVVYHANYSYPENPLYKWFNMGKMALHYWTPIAADINQLPVLSPLFVKIMNYAEKIVYSLVYDVWPTIFYAFNFLFYSSLARHFL